jgi:hypothetical protein
MAIGRISGPLLKANLVRNGIDLAFETDLLYLDVNNNRIGIKTSAPQYELDVNGTTRTTNLIVTNRADIGSVNIEGNTISSDQQYLNLGTLDNVIYQNKLRVDSIDIETNVISTNNTNANLEFRPNGTGRVEVYSNMNVDGDIHATGNISADGNITLGNEDTDNVVFNAEIASDIIPDIDITYDLGTDLKRWNDIWVRNIVTDGVNADDLEVDGIDLILRQGKIWYVATNGNDLKQGNHPQDPYATLKKALTVAQPGDTVYMYPGTYTEIFPLTIPVGVAVKGQGIRSVKIVPTLGTQNNDAFLLNGESTIEDLTIADFYSPGYAFKYAPGFTVTSRSPYIRNISVITKGSVITLEDPRGFNAGDAGRGGFFDGAVATAGSNEASVLFHSVTFITPGVDAIVLTNGVRVEWLNSFTYFANRSIFAEDGATGLKGTGQTSLRVDNLSGTITVGETVSYYDTDGVTLLESATIASIDGTGKIFVSGKQTGFETASERGGKTITANGDAKLSTAVKKFGSASLALDGAGDYAFIQSNNDFAFGTGDFTVEGWFYRSVGGVQVTLFDFRTAATQNAPWVFITSGGTLAYYVNGSTRISGAGGITAGSWHHVAVSRSGTNTKMFVNGTQIGVTWTDTTNYIQSPLTIGARFTGALEFFNGYIDDLRIVKGAAVYTANFTAPVTRVSVTPETVLMARFDGTNNSTTFADDVIYSQDVRFSGGATATGITLADFTDFGAEVRLIGSASVYGNFGLVGDGPGVIMYAIGQNLAYIGNGKEVTNDPLTVIQANEVVETNNAKIYYTSVDHKGDFRVGDLFYVNQADGTVNFSVSDFTINTTGGVTFTDGASSTFIDGTKIETGNWRISGNTVETLTGDANFEAASGEINLDSNVTVTGNLDVTGNVTVGGNIIIGNEATDTIQIIAGIDSDIVPKIDSTYSLGTSTKTWSNLFVNQVNVDGIEIRDNYIETTASNSNLELRANGTGEVLVPSNDVQIDNDLTVTGTTTLANTVIQGTFDLTGDFTQTGDYSVTGNLSVGQNLTVGAAAQFEEILVDDNFITTTSTNTNLELRANGTGVVLVPNNNVVITNDLTVVGDIDANNIDITATLTANDANIGDISISGTSVEATVSNADLELRANGTGEILVPSNDVVLGQDLTVQGATDLQALTVTGTITHTGDVTQTGIFTLAGEFTNGNILIEDNFITTTVSNSNLELRANGTGTILIPNNNVDITNNLTVVGFTSLQNTEITGTITHTGDVTQTGNINLTGNAAVTGTLTVSSSAQFEDIRIENNLVTTTQTNSDLQLSAAGSGSVVIPNNNVQIVNDLAVNGTITVGDITSSGTITANRFSTGNILIDDNFITTTITNSDLELRANGTGSVIVPSNDVEFGQDLTVSGDTDLQDLTVTGTITHTGDVTQTGNINLTGAMNVTGTVTVSSTAQFEDIRISGNTVTTTQSNSNLSLRASGSNIVSIPSNDVLIPGALTVNGVLSVGAINSSGTIQANNFTTGNILIDDNFITTTISNSDLELRAQGTGSIVIDSFDINDSTISSASDFTLAPGSRVLVIDATGALRLPVGTTDDRPAAAAGQIRFNSELGRYEGYNGTNWIQLNGVVDLDGDTRVTAELTEGANDNTIRFTVAGSTVVDVNSTRLNAPRVTVDSIQLDGNVISTTTANTNLVLDPNGTGSVVIDNFAIRNNTITNTVPNSITTFANTNNGYVKFDGTYGLVLPTGSTGQRPPELSSEIGMTRFNTTDDRVEVWNGDEWISVAGAESGISRSDAENIAFEIVLSLG